MTAERLPVLWLSGPSGVGKSTVGWEVYTQLGRDGVKAAFVDADQLALCYPAPEGSTHRLRARNLAALWRNFRAAGMRCLVLAGFVDTPEEAAQYTRLLPDAEFSLCRLRVADAELRRRFLARGRLPDLVEDAVAEAGALDRGGFPETCVDTDGLTVSEVAHLVRRRLRPATGPDGHRGNVVAAQPVPAEKLPLLWFTGPTAVGKSTVGYQVFRRLYGTGTRTAYLDLKQITALPAADGRLKADNLAAVWAGFRAAGARRLIVSGEADTGESIGHYADALADLTPTVCRLHASPETLRQRVAERGRGGGPTIPGDPIKGLDPDGLRRVADRAAHEAAALDRTGTGDLRIDTDGRSPQEVAEDVLNRLGERVLSVDTQD
jgi:adenylylsulfate kinase-like enzyme